MKKYLLKVNSEKLWKDFVKTIPREIDINSAIIELLRQKVGQNKMSKKEKQEDET